MDDLYKEILIDHHKNPRNFEVLENCSFKFRDKNPLCGDEVEIFGVVSDDVLRKISFDGKGCIICMASSSLLTDELKGKALGFVLDMKREDWLDLIGAKLSASRVKCAMLPLMALKKGILNYKGEIK